MLLRVLIPVLVVAALMIGGFVLYRRKIISMSPGESTIPSSSRLTAERLRTLPTPPWHVVFEIPEGKAAAIDHVVIGPPGVVAITTVLSERPAPTEPDDSPTTVAQAAIARAEVSEFLASVNGSCDILATVFWGAAQPDVPAAYRTTHGAFAVDGHRLTEWLMTLPPAPVAAAQLDQWWQAVTVGLGRPDPLS